MRTPPGLDPSVETGPDPISSAAPRSLLVGAAAEAARSAARYVVVEIAAEPACASAVDRAVLFAYAAGVFDEPFVERARGQAIDDLIGELSRGVPHLGLFGGLAGTAWALAHVLDGDGLDAIDEWFVRALGADAWPGPHDLVTGLAGIGVYFVERIASGAAGDAAHDGLAHVVRHLAANARRCAAGTYWHTEAAHLPAQLAAENPRGFDDCGVAHGTPGVIGLLSRAAELSDATAKRLCEDAVRWLIAQRVRGSDPVIARVRDSAVIASCAPPAQLPLSSGSFPTSAGDDEPARAAWCYGDPGIAAALWRAAPELARETALVATARSLETSGVRDAGLCHGAAGLAHLFGRCYRATGDAAYGDAARTWLSRALALPHHDKSLLEGSIGVALALLAATTEVEPAWDRLLLCDLPQGERP